MSVKEAYVAALKGMNLAASAEEKENPGWLSMGLEVLYDLAVAQEHIHIDDFWNEIARRHPRPKDTKGHSYWAPTHPNSVGALWRKAKSSGWIKVSDLPWRMAEERATIKRRPYPVYVSLVRA
jgi:hypothetical protein